MLFDTIFMKSFRLVIQLLESLLGNTAEITSVVPLLIALAPTENQTALSWTHDEMFEWMTFEEHDIDFRLGFWFLL